MDCDDTVPEDLTAVAPVQFDRLVLMLLVVVLQSVERLPLGQSVFGLL